MIYIVRPECVQAWRQVFLDGALLVLHRVLQHLRNRGLPSDSARSWDMFACEAGVSMDQVKFAYYAVMICETFDGALVSFIYFVLRAFPKSQYTSLMLHHILSAVGLSYGYFAGGHPDLFAAIVSLDVLVPIWYLYRLYPSKLLYTLRGTLVAYGRLFVVLSTCALCVHHLNCMEDKVKAASP